MRGEGLAWRAAWLTTYGSYPSNRAFLSLGLDSSRSLWLVTWFLAALETGQHMERSPLNLGCSCLGAAKTKIMSNSKWNRAKLDQTHCLNGYIVLPASSSMCADALQCMWVWRTGLGLAPEPSRTGLLFGSASWQIREVATAFCVTLLNYNHISAHGWNCFKHTEIRARS